MAVTCGFFNALEHDRLYDAIQMSSIFDGIIRDGIFSTIGTSMAVTASGSGLVVNVGAGRAWFNHTWILNDTQYPVEAEAAEVVLDRIDALVIEVNQSAEVRDCSIKFIKGTPSSRPVRPTMIHNAEVNQYALAYVSIRAGQTTIFQADITSVIGNDETPFITGLLQQTSIESIVAQWQDEFYTYFNNFRSTTTSDFNTWMAARVAEYNAWYAAMEAEGQADLAEFDSWFQEMKDQLSEDAAGHLQAEIDALEASAEKGSVVTVTTSDDTLINHACTISQGSAQRNATFDINKTATFESIPFVGDMNITATNGTLIASKNINIPYFGRYEYDLEFWEATLAISSSSTELYERPITIAKGGITVGTTSFDNTGHATFKVHEPGTYTVTSTTTGGAVFTANVEVTAETSYPVDLGTPIGKTALPTDDIQLWLKCGGEYDVNYTTLAEVLADTELFARLCADSNACDYMARSTTWASTVCANSTAMQIVGMFDYCAEALLSNSTWAISIIQSTYVDSVCDVKVPVMTSNTTPSGTVIYGNQQTSNQAYYAFDNDINTFWSGTPHPQYIGYDFGEAVRIYGVSIMSASNTPYIADGNIITSFKIQGSDDNVTYHDKSDTLTVSTTRNVTSYFAVNGDTAYRYNKLQVISNNGGAYDVITSLQFYGRTKKTAEEGIAIHSAANDTIYYLDGSTPVTVAVTDANGKAVIDTEDLDPGTYTLYSTVAKNPDNLSNPYTKTVKINGNTTEIYVMPIKSLYWWGYKNGDVIINTGTTVNTNNLYQQPSTAYKYFMLNRMLDRKDGFTKLKTVCQGLQQSPYRPVIRIFASASFNTSDGREIIYTDNASSISTLSVNKNNSSYGSSGKVYVGLYTEADSSHRNAYQYVYAIWFE